MRFLTVALSLLVIGCGASNYIPTSYYAVDPPINVEHAPTIDAALGLRPLQAPRTYAKGIVAREANLEVVYLPHATWTDRPQDVLTRALTDALTSSSRFKDVGNASDMFAPDYILTGELRRFDILRNETPWAVICEARLELRHGQERDAVWQDTIQVRKTVEDAGIPAAAHAMSKAVGELASRVAQDIIHATATGE